MLGRALGILLVIFGVLYALAARHIRDRGIRSIEISWIQRESYVKVLRGAGILMALAGAAILVAVGLAER